MSDLNDYLKTFFATYDSVDLLSKISALNLVFENQNKNLYTTYLTTYALFNLNTGKPKASSKTFKSIIMKAHDEAWLSNMVDPSESPFFEFAFLDKEYGVFNGINTSSAFYVNSIIETLLYRENELPIGFKNKALRFIKASLVISDSIYKKINISFEDISEHQYVENIIIPSNLDMLKSSVFIDKKETLNNLSYEELKNYFLVNIKDKDLDEELKSELPFYYDSPFIEVDNNILCIDPTAICYFIKKICINLSREFNCEKEFVIEYNNSVVSSSINLAKTISGISLHNNKIILKEDTDYYKAFAFNVGTNKSVLLAFACDNSTVDPYSKDYKPTHIDCDLMLRKTLNELDRLGYANKYLYSMIILSSITGTLTYSSNIKFDNPPLIIPACDVPIIQINESKTPYFLQCFSNLINNGLGEKNFSMIFSMTNLISMISERNYDLYLDDEIRIKDILLNIIPDFIYPYSVKAIAKRYYSVAIFKGINIPIQLIKAEENIYFNNPITGFIQNVRLLYLRLDRTGIWTYSNIDDQNGALVSRSVLYWLNQIRNTLSKHLNFNVYIQITNTKKNYEVKKIKDDVCVLNYSDDFISSQSNSNNSNEISIVIEILKCFDLFNNEIALDLYEKSNVENKKIIYVLKLSGEQTQKPLNISLLPIKSEKMLESIIDNNIGEFLVNGVSLEFGKLTNPSETIKRVVEYLYSKFEKELKKFNWKSAVELCYLYVENLMQELSLFQDNMKHQMILYPNQESEIKENYNRINTASVSLRFVIEYLSTIQPEGNENMNEFDMIKVISLSSSIIKWARIDDAFKYGLLEKAELLKSCRIGFDHSNLNKFNEIVSDVVSFDVSHKLSYNACNIAKWPFKKELDDAYKYEHGYTTDDIMRVIAVFLAIGDKQESEIKFISKDEMISFLNKHANLNLNEDIFLRVVDSISIKKRTVFYDKNIKPRELHPWKYNRCESLMRKPIVDCENSYLWGNRMTEHLYYHVMQTIYNGKEPSNKTGKMSINTLNGKILEFSGNEFNDKCFEYLSNLMPNIYFDKCVKSINNLKISNGNNETLGDIDLLGIDREKKKIYLIETKNFFYSRDPSELNVEIQEMFIDMPKRKSFLTKELNRVLWVKSHVSDLIKHYKLEEGDWKVRYTFLTNKPLISKEFSNRKINSTSLKVISLKYLRSLKNE